jgi:hypothetical protein
MSFELELQYIWSYLIPFILINLMLISSIGALSELTTHYFTISRLFLMTTAYIF